MLAYDEVLAWFVVAAALVTIPLLSIYPERAFRALEPRLTALAGRTAEHFRPVEEVDPLAEALRAQIRQEKLVADVQRLRRVVSSDQHMSAVRQLGNRIAYASLLQELETTRSAPPLYSFAALAVLDPPDTTPVSRWQDDLALPVPAATRFRERDGQRAPAVEVLELGPRRRATR